MIAFHLRTRLALFALLGIATASMGQSSTATKTPKGAASRKSSPASKAAPQQSSGARTGDWRQIKKPPLPPHHPQEPKRIELANGMIVFLEEDHELPLIDGTAYVRGGSRDVAAEKTGLTSIYASAWRTGGTKAKTGDELDNELEARAAKVETGSGAATTSISFSSLKGDFDFVFDVFKDVLRNPEFRQDKIDLAKNRLKSTI